MKRFYPVIFLLVWACDSGPGYPIGDPPSSVSFYQEQLRQINDEIQSKKVSDKILIKKLYASQQLNWPEDVSAELNQLLIKDGLNHELYQFGSDFYRKWERYSELNQLVDRWLRVHPPTSEDLKLKVIALTGMGKPDQASSLLWSLTLNSSSAENLLFAARNYLEAADTAKAMLAYARLADSAPRDSSLLEEYIPLLLNKGYATKAKDLLVYQRPYIKGFSGQSVLAKTLYSMGETEEAFSIVRSYERPEAFQLLSNWYRQQNNWDSAVYYTDQLIRLDSSKALLIQKAVILEERGSLEGSLEILRLLAERNPEDTVVISRADLVEGKIAYLRRLRESQRRIPVLNLTPKKSTENE